MDRNMIIGENRAVYDAVIQALEQRVKYEHRAREVARVAAYALSDALIQSAEHATDRSGFYRVAALVEEMAQRIAERPGDES